MFNKSFFKHVTFFGLLLLLGLGVIFMVRVL